jgi:hypothetical protein
MSLSAIVEAEEKELRDIGWDGVSFVFHGMVLYHRTGDWLNAVLLWGRHDQHGHQGHHGQGHGGHHGQGHEDEPPYHVAQLLDGATERSLALTALSISGTPHNRPGIECRHPSSSDYRQVLPDLGQVAQGRPLHAARPDEHGPFQSVLRVRNAWVIVSGPMDPEFNDKVFEFRPHGPNGAQRTWVTDIVKVRVQKPEAIGLPEGVQLTAGRAFAIHNDFNGAKNPLSADNPVLEHSALYQAALNPPPSPTRYLTWVEDAAGLDTPPGSSTARRMFNWTDPICELERFGDL